MNSPARLCVVMAILAATACDAGSDGPLGNSTCGYDRDCDDSIACTLDRCVLTVNGFKRCENTPDDDLCEPGFLCLVDSLLGPGCNDPARLACANKSDGEGCTTADACATGNGVCTGSVCIYPVKECADRPCLVSLGCARDSGTCRYTIAAKESLCDADGDRCTQDHCSGGVCLEGPDTCECSDTRPCVQPANKCLGEAVCELGKCVSEPVDCESGNTACMQYYCVPATGLCASVAVNEGGSCEDDLKCTGPGICAAGSCLTGEFKCPDRACNTVECVEPDGCVYTPHGTDCDDGNRCNGPDACSMGQCLPAGIGTSCDDRNQCTTDTCVPETGICVNTPVANCCGNGLLDSGEQCDGQGLPQSGCISCGFSVVNLEYQGISPSWAWSDDLQAGLVTWEIVDSEGGRGLALRQMSSLGSLGETIPIPAGTVRDRSMSPVVTSSPVGFILGALTSSAPEFWLIDKSGRPRFRTEARNPWNKGVPLGKLVAAWSMPRSVAAWNVEAPDGSQQLLYSDLAVGQDQILVSAASVLFASGRGGAVIPGDACATDDGVVVMFTVRDESGSMSVIHQKAAFLQGGTSAVTIFDLAQSEWDQPYTGRCAMGADGRVLAVYPRMVGGATPGIVAEAVLLDTVDGPGIPANIASGTAADSDVIVPFYSDIVARNDAGYLFLCPSMSPSFAAPDQIRPVAFYIGADGRLVSGPETIEGPTGAFTGSIAAGPAGGPNISLFWVETNQLAQLFTKGQVAGRVYQVGELGL